MCMHVYIVFCRFNMPHDDSNKCKEDGVKIQQHVMAPTLNYYTNPWMWSKCSRKYITEFLEYVLQIMVAFCEFYTVISSYSVQNNETCSRDGSMHVLKVIFFTKLVQSAPVLQIFELNYIQVHQHTLKAFLCVCVSCFSLVCFVFFLKSFLSSLISTGYGECLLDEPVSRPYPLPQQLPGRIYSVNQQCELIFGPGTQVCPYMVSQHCIALIMI